MILWDTAHDRFTPGQWFRGSIRSCSLSPDGELVVYHAAKYSPTARRSAAGTSWTAVSVPPAFEALHMWPVWVDWVKGGGVFLDDRTLQLHHHRRTLEEIGPRVGELRVVQGEWLRSETSVERSWWTPSPSQGDDGPSRQAVWPSPGSGRRGARACPKGVALVRLEKALPNGAVERRYVLQHSTGKEHLLAGVDFAAFDPRGRLIFARDGALLLGEVAADRLIEHTFADFRDDQPDPKPWKGTP